MSEPLLAHDKCSPKATAQLQIPSDQDRTGRWQAFFVPTALLCLSISGTVIFPLYISKSATTPRNNENSGDTTNFGCDPSGNTFSTYEPPNLFDTRYTFAINLGFGEFEFAAAKLIDVGWDLVLSRGGQALVALCIYRTFRRSMLNGSETSTMSYDKFLALSYAPDTFLALLWLDGMFLRHDGKVEDVFGALRAAFLVVSSFHAEVGAEATILREKELRWQIKQASAHVRIRPMELIARPHGTVFWTEMNYDTIQLKPSNIAQMYQAERRSLSIVPLKNLMPPSMSDPTLVGMKGRKSHVAFPTLFNLCNSVRRTIAQAVTTSPTRKQEMMLYPQVSP
ncbi:uncharacterized protein MYCGRDRAFT_91137 [Zymoseptoria tritici IPO323]|uniref:Uncharacterized protein n=1 Tax=Zymoseptoria tritici (strain CBS 115943 / IPO323) TaxID=336722 RepID=F9X394_ZYMTI|nr:uncharacterized protein MYCGRDRAFT_91137 [Zymoseptoria tritici IPO323]EGP90296.1 hypothetical protein MYCGRDRAFT_91137 [Zymoseptoria tritici IPO323]